MLCRAAWGSWYPIFSGQSHQLIHIYIRPQGRKPELALLNKKYRPQGRKPGRHAKFAWSTRAHHHGNTTTTAKNNLFLLSWRMVQLKLQSK